MNKNSNSRFMTPEGKILTSAEMEELLLKQLKSKDGKCEQSLFNLAQLYSQSGRVDEAVRCIERLLELSDDPERHAGYCLKLGCDMEKIDDYKSAVRFYRQALALEPRRAAVSYWIHNNLGYSLNQLQAFDDAMPLLRRAIEIDPQKPNAYKNLGLASQATGHLEEAAKLFVKATQVNAADPRSLKHLEELMCAHPDLEAQVLGLSGELKACRKAVNMAKAFSPDLQAISHTQRQDQEKHSPMTCQETFEAFNALARLDVYCSDIFLFSANYAPGPLPFFHRSSSGKCYFDIFERCLCHTRDAVKPLGNPKVNATLNEMVNLTKRMIEGHATQPWVPYRSPTSSNVVPPALQLNLAGISLYLASGTIWNYLAKRVASIVSVWPSPDAVKTGDRPYWQVTLPGHDPVRVAYTGTIDAAFHALLADTGLKVLPIALPQGSEKPCWPPMGVKGITDGKNVTQSTGMFWSSHLDMAIQGGYIQAERQTLPRGVQAFTIMPDGCTSGSIDLNCRVRSQSELMTRCGWRGSSDIDTNIEGIAESMSRTCGC